MDIDKVDEIVELYSRNAEKEFTQEELAAFVRDVIKADVDEDTIGELAESNGYLFSEGFRDSPFIPRRTFFKGAQFRIVPLPEEIEGGYLIPGHRFIPFISREIFPGEAQLLLPDGKDATVRQVEVAQRMTQMVLRFFGAYQSIDYLVADAEENAERILPPYDQPVQVSVFDLSELYAAHCFKPGDALLVTVQDWLRGIYSIERVVKAAEPRDPKRCDRWLDSMDLSVASAMDKLEMLGDCTEQLAWAIYLAQQDPECISLMEHPPFSMVEWVNHQDLLVVKQLGEMPVLWEIDEDLPSELHEDDLPCSELDAIFEELGLSITEEEVEAYMRDALFHGEGRADAVLARIATGRSLIFSSGEEQERFHCLWSELWEKVKGLYDAAEDPFAGPRGRMLQLNDRSLAVLRELDGRGTDLMAVMHNPAFIELSQLSAMISQTMVLFNRPASEVGDAAVFPEQMLEQLELTVDQLVEKLKAGESGAQCAKRPVVSESTDVFQLKVSIKGAKPPIWRRVLVPSTMPLDDLHYVIQEAMGWQDCHLYQFIDKRVMYQPNPDSDMMMGFAGFKTFDSDGVLIDHLLGPGRAKKIVYEYDFGDSWEHEVLLEKVLSADLELNYPACIKGKRACPPEDCGGIWGYYSLLERLDDRNDEEYDDLVEWYGDLDPEKFDLEAAQQRLRRRFK